MKKGGNKWWKIALPNTYVFLLLVKASSPSGLLLPSIDGNGNTYQSCVFYLPFKRFYVSLLCADGNATRSRGSSFMDFAATDAFQIVWMAIPTNSIEQNRIEWGSESRAKWSLLGKFIDSYVGRKTPLYVMLKL